MREREGKGDGGGRGGRREGGDIRGIETAISFVYLIDRRLKRSLSLLFIKILRFEINKRERCRGRLDCTRKVCNNNFSSPGSRKNIKKINIFFIFFPTGAYPPSREGMHSPLPLERERGLR